MIPHPVRPGDIAEDERGAADLRPRYEDIAQDGRLVLTALMPGIGASAWSALAKRSDALLGLRQNGVLPILRRLVIVGEEGPFSVDRPIHFEGAYRLAKEAGGERLFLNMWMEASAAHASTYGPPVAKDAPRAPVGRVFAEHVVTTPFAPAGARKVTAADLGALPPPRDEHVFEAAEAIVAGVTLEDAGEVAFGMMHTDSNQHVNSMVYPRMFEEAVVRRLGAKELLARAVEMRWRKPFFAGERASVRIAMVDAVTAVGSFAPPGAERPSCTVRMVMG